MNSLQRFLLKRPLYVHSAQTFSPGGCLQDVKEAFCHSFSFAVTTEQQADIDERDSSCAHTSEGPPEWSRSEFHYAERDEARLMTGRPTPTRRSDGPKLYTANAIF